MKMKVFVKLLGCCARVAIVNVNCGWRARQVKVGADRCEREWGGRRWVRVRTCRCNSTCNYALRAQMKVQESGDIPR